MKKLLLTALFLAIPLTVAATSWAYAFVVYNDGIYIISEEETTDVTQKIGEVTNYSDMYQAGGNFSNIYEKGTAYYEIDSIDPAEAIAVQVEEGRYIIAHYDGAYEYTPSINNTVEKITDLINPVVEPVYRESGGGFMYIVIGLVVGVLVLVFIVRRRDKK